MARGSQSVGGRAALALPVLIVGLALFGCGGSGGDGAAELAKQEQIQAAREQAAQDARQSAKITELEHRLGGANTRARGKAAAPSAATPSAGSAASADLEEPLTGLWKGEAVIRYDNGESDLFNETIDIESFRLEEVSGYGEAHQGSTTCHGPITYQGVSGGWYLFSAEERNVAECIDYSELKLMPDGSGGLNYRETTEVSVSTGTLERVK